MGIVIVADRCLHRDGLLGDLHNLENFVLGQLHQLRKLAGIGLDARFLQDLARDAIHAVDRLDHVHGNADRTGLVRDRTRDGLTDPPGGIGRELVAAAVLELVDGFHEADIAS